MARENKEVKTHLEMVAIIDDYIERYYNKGGIRLTYTQATKLIAERIKNAGGIKL